MMRKKPVLIFALAILVFSVWSLIRPDFVFGIKGSRFISHILKLDNSLEPIKSLWQGVRLLGGKAGPVFLQLPNQFELNQYRLEKFVQNLPTKLKIALEFGHPSWYQNQVFSILEEKNVGLVLNKDTLKQGIAPITANFVYVRLPGTDGDGEGKIEEGDLAVWAKSITGWLERGLDVFVYFTNHQQARAIQDAKELKNLLNC